MPECSNCGSFVTTDYVRVACRPDESPCDACPYCPDRVRHNGFPEDASKAAGHRGRNTTSYDPSYGAE